MVADAPSPGSGPSSGPGRTSGESADPSGRFLTLPNVLGLIRLVGSPGLVVLAAAGRETAFLLLFLVLTFTDWIDGKLAKWLDQRSALGARLDTAADGAMYGALLIGLGLLKADVFVAEWPWIAAGCAAWALSAGVSLVRFGRVPSYHTRLAKTSWLLALATVVALFTVGWVWPLRATAAAVTLTNLEATLISLKLRERRVDVSSIFALPPRDDG